MGERGASRTGGAHGATRFAVFARFPGFTTTAARVTASAPTALQHLFALFAYWVIVLVLFGLRLRGHFTDHLLSSTPADASFFVWSFRWWPHALVHGLQPLYTHAVFAPTGFNLAWATAIPLPGVVMAPVTLVFGPFVAFNIVALLAPTTAAWTTYLLCRRVTGSGLASFAGGFIFGFSTYESLVVSAGHLNLSLALMVPLCAYVFVRHLQGSLHDRAFVLLMAATLAGQFLISTEVFATMTLLGALTVSIGILFTGRSRRTLVRTGAFALVAYGAAGLALLPFLYTAFAASVPAKIFVHATAAGAPNLNQTLESYVFPATMTQVGRGLLFHGPVPKNGSYLGIPLLLILALVTVSRWKSPAVRTLAVAFGAICVLSLGAYQRFGSGVVALPWSALGRLPLLNRVVASRLVMFAFLIASVAVAVWAAGTTHRWIRWALVAVAALSILPHTGAHIWTSGVSIPAFIRAGTFIRYLEPGETVVVIAPGRQQQMYWQADADLYFRLAGGYMGGIPPDFVDAPFEQRLASGDFGTADVPELRRFVAEHDVGALIVAPGLPYVEAALQELVGPPVRAGGVVMFRVPPEWSLRAPASARSP